MVNHLAQLLQRKFLLISQSKHITPVKNHHCILEDVKPEITHDLEIAAKDGDKNQMTTPNLTPSSLSQSMATKEKPRYYPTSGLSNIHRITPQYPKPKTSGEVLYGTGETPIKRKSFYEKIYKREYREKPDSKEFSDFLVGLREQMTIARKIMPHAGKYAEMKTVRLKRDFKSRFL